MAWMATVRVSMRWLGLRVGVRVGVSMAIGLAWLGLRARVRA